MECFVANMKSRFKSYTLSMIDCPLLGENTIQPESLNLFFFFFSTFSQEDDNILFETTPLKKDMITWEYRYMKIR